MKKTITIIAMFMLFGMISFVSAIDNTTSTIYGENNTSVSNNIIDAGIVPGDFFYAADRGLDNLGLFLTFNKEKKIEKSLDIAEERLAEAEELAENGEMEKAKIAQEGHDKFLDKAQTKFDQFEAKDENSLRDIAKIKDRFDAHEQKILDVKAKVFAKLSESLTDEELAILNEVFANFEAKIKNARNNAKENQFIKERKYQEDSNLSDEEITKLLDRIDEEEGITENRKIRSEKENQYFDNKISNLKRNLLKFENLLNSENLSIKKKADITKRIRKLKIDINKAQIKKQEKAYERLSENNENYKDSEDKEVPEAEEDKEVPEAEEDKEVPEAEEDSNSNEREENSADIGEVDTVVPNSSEGVDIPADIGEIDTVVPNSSSDTNSS